MSNQPERSRAEKVAHFKKVFQSVKQLEGNNAPSNQLANPNTSENNPQKFLIELTAIRHNYQKTK